MFSKQHSEQSTTLSSLTISYNSWVEHTFVPNNSQNLLILLHQIKENNNIKQIYCCIFEKTVYSPQIQNLLKSLNDFDFEEMYDQTKDKRFMEFLQKNYDKNITGKQIRKLLDDLYSYKNTQFCGCKFFTNPKIFAEI
jgi:hypothetical protein